MRKGIFILFYLLCTSTILIGQEDNRVHQTFKDTRVVNSPSVETLKAGQLDFRIGHRFGDLWGNSGGWETFYGLENAADIQMGLEYGVSNNFLIGLHRTKGNGPLKQNVSGVLKIKLARQQVSGLPFTATIMAMASASTMPRSRNKGALNYFEKFAHRLVYHVDAIVGRKFNNYLSMQVFGGVTYRNLVPATDINELPSVGAAVRLQITKPLALLLDSRYMFNGERNDNNFLPMFGAALEYETGGGHVFQLNFVNSGGMMETDYIPYTTQNPLEGQFRIGFTISRLFRV